MPEIEAVIAQQRRELLARETRVLARLDALYSGAINEAAARAERLPQPDTPSRLLRVGRSTILITQLEGELERIRSTSLSLLERERRDVVALSGEHLQDLLGALDVRVGIDPLAIERIGGALGPTSPLSELLSSVSADGAAAARSALFNGIALGDNPRTIARALRRALDVPRWRAATIARTETLRAYRGAMRTRMQDSKAVAGWRWSCARDRRSCAMCWAMHGRRFDVDEEFGSHPNCRCSQAPLTANSFVDIGVGEELFANLPFERQIRTLGPAKYRAYAAGRIRLTDLVGHSFHPKWGPIRFERSLLSVLGRADARRFYRQPVPRPTPIPPRPAPIPPRPTPIPPVPVPAPSRARAPAPARARAPIDSIGSAPISAATLRAFDRAETLMQAAARESSAGVMVAARAQLRAVKRLLAEWGMPSTWNGKLQQKRVTDSTYGWKDGSCSVVLTSAGISRGASDILHTMTHEMSHTIGNLWGKTDQPYQLYGTGARRWAEEAATETIARAIDRRVHALNPKLAERAPDRGRFDTYDDAVIYLERVARAQGKTGEQLALELKRALQEQGTAHDWAAREAILFRGWTSGQRETFEAFAAPYMHISATRAIDQVLGQLGGS